MSKELKPESKPQSSFNYFKKYNLGEHCWDGTCHNGTIYVCLGNNMEPDLV